MYCPAWQMLGLLLIVLCSGLSAIVIKTLLLLLLNDVRKAEKNLFFFGRECIPKSVLSATTLSYSDIFSESICCLFSLWTNFCAFFPGNFLPSSTVSPSEFFVKIVQINLLGDATVLSAAHSVYE